MTVSLILLLSLASVIPSGDPLDTALTSYRAVASYRVTIHSRSDDSAEIFRYFFKRPGFVRMEFIQPHKGAILVYNPLKKEARLQPFGFFTSFVLTLRPDNPMITSARGHRVDASDIGALLDTARLLREKGRTRTTKIVAEGGRKRILLAIEGDDGVIVAGSVHRCILWLDAETFLPVRTITYEENGALIEDVTLEGLVTNIDLPDTLFEL
jgi:outer membrane lipoprotein-sorting protein